MHDFAHRVFKSRESSTCADIPALRRHLLLWECCIGCDSPLNDLMTHSGKYRICDVADHHLLIMTLFMWGTLKAPEHSNTHIKNTYRLQKIPVDSPFEWNRTDRSWKNMYSQETLKTQQNTCLPFFFPLCAWKYVRKRSEIELKHDSIEFLTVPLQEKSLFQRRKRDPGCPTRSSSLALHTQMEARTHVRMYSKEVLI